MTSISAATGPRLRLWREASDTHIRSRFGGYYYLLAWAMLWLTSRNPGQNLWLWSSGALLLLGFFILRSSERPTEQLPAEQLQRWLDQRWILILLQSLAWGLMLAGIELHPGVIVSHLVVMLCVVVFATALAFTYPMRMASCALAILLTYLPSTAVKIHLGIGDIGESVALVIYLMNTPMRRRRLREAEARAAAAEASADSGSVQPDAGSLPAGAPVSPERKEP